MIDSSRSRSAVVPSRRAVLATGFTAVAGLVAGPALWPGVWPAESRAAAGPTPLPALPAPSPAVVAPPSLLAVHQSGGDPVEHPIRPHPVPAWARRWPTAIRSVTDFQHRCPDPHYARNAIMLTIDDGPSPVWTPRYLRLLAKHDVTATFCMIGRQVLPNRHLARAVASEGHTIANHTWTHDEQLEIRPVSRIRSELTRTSAAIHTATGTVPTQFRAPGGAWGPRIFAELARLRMMPLGWDIDPTDWALPGTESIERSMLAAGRHDIILCHDGGGDRSETYAALERVIPELLARGYEFVTLP